MRPLASRTYGGSMDERATTVASQPGEQAAGVAARGVEIVKRYGEGATAVEALRGVSVAFERGTFSAIMGPSGLGQVNADAHPRRAGRAHWRVGRAGRNADRLTVRPRHHRNAPARDRLRVPDFNLLPVLTAEENITLPLRIGGEEVDRDWLETLLETFISTIAACTGPASCPAESSSGWPSPAP